MCFYVQDPLGNKCEAGAGHGQGMTCFKLFRLGCGNGLCLASETPNLSGFCGAQGCESGATCTFCHLCPPGGEVETAHFPWIQRKSPQVKRSVDAKADVMCRFC